MIDRKILLKDHQAYLIESTWVSPEWDDNDIVTKPGYFNTKETKVDSLGEYLGLEVETGDNFTFGDLWLLIRPDMQMYNKIYKDELGKYKLEKYDEEFDQEPDAEHVARINADETEGNCIKYLEISTCYDYTENWKDPNNQDGKMSLYRYIDFSGIGPHTHGDFSCEDMHWAIDFMGINMIKAYPLKINNRVYIQDDSKEPGKLVNLLSENTISEITVYDMLRGIFYEITYFGNPEDRNGIFTELSKAISDAKENLEKEQ